MAQVFNGHWCYFVVIGYDITEGFSTYHDSTAVQSCGKYSSDQLVDFVCIVGVKLPRVFSLTGARPSEV